MQAIKSNAAPLAKFLLGGGVNYFLNIFLTAFLTETLGLNYIISFSVTQSILIVYGYIYNSRVVYRTKHSNNKMFRFVSLMILFAILNIFVVRNIVEIFELSYVYTIAFIIPITTLIKYFVYKKIAFQV